MLTARPLLEELATKFDLAVCPEEIFGNLPGPASEQLELLRFKERQYTRNCHPDLAPPNDKTLATEVFQKLGRWSEIARQKVEIGTYGDFVPYAPPPPPYEQTELTIGGRTLKLTGLIGEGLIASVHRAEYTDDDDQENSLFVKYARDTNDNDLLEKEFFTLKDLQLTHPSSTIEAFFETQRVYAPRPLQSFFIQDENGFKHRANLLTVPEGQCYTVQTLREEKFPEGIEPRHVWWIFRRLLLTLWMAHLKGYVHGAVTPDHLLVYPEAHGIVLLDWSCASRIEEEYIPVMNPDFLDFYPPETRHKALAHPSADLYMAAATAIYMLGGNPSTGEMPDSVAFPLQQALLHCLSPSAAHRPEDAEEFHNDFGKLLGKRTYSHMIVP